MSGTRTPHRRRRVSASERAQRNARMSSRKAQGATWAEIAAEFGCAASTAQQGVADHLAAAGASAPAVQPIDLRNVRADEVVEDALGTYAWATERLRALAVDADNSSAKVAAIRSVIDLTDRQINLLVRAGAIPGGEAAQVARITARIHDEHRAFLRTVFDALDELGVSYEAVAPRLTRTFPELAAA